jgi:hypothetical protein
MNMCHMWKWVSLWKMVSTSHLQDPKSTSQSTEKYRQNILLNPWLGTLMWRLWESKWSSKSGGSIQQHKVILSFLYLFLTNYQPYWQVFLISIFNIFISKQKRVLTLKIWKFSTLSLSLPFRFYRWLSFLYFLYLPQFFYKYK